MSCSFMRTYLIRIKRCSSNLTILRINKAAQFMLSLSFSSKSPNSTIAKIVVDLHVSVLWYKPCHGNVSQLAQSLAENGFGQPQPAEPSPRDPQPSSPTHRKDAIFIHFQLPIATRPFSCHHRNQFRSPFLYLSRDGPIRILIGMRRRAGFLNWILTGRRQNKQEAHQISISLIGFRTLVVQRWILPIRRGNVLQLRFRTQLIGAIMG